MDARAFPRTPTRGQGVRVHANLGVVITPLFLLLQRSNAHPQEDTEQGRGVLAGGEALVLDLEKAESGHEFVAETLHDGRPT